MRKRIFALIMTAALCVFGLSSCALAESCQASCNHIYGATQRREATCKSNGSVYRQCILCSKIEVIQTISKVDHDYVFHVANSYGCLGYSGYYECTYCEQRAVEYLNFGYRDGSSYCFTHDYDFENPVSVIVDADDPECAVYEYRCKNPECTDEDATITLHACTHEQIEWYERYKDRGAYSSSYHTCDACGENSYAYTYKWAEKYAVFKEPSDGNDYAIVGFLIEGKTFGRCVKLTYDEYNRVLAGEIPEFPLPAFIENI